MTGPEPQSRQSDLPSFTFGDSAALSETLLSLVRSGRKTATCGALRDYLKDGDPLPAAGERWVVTDWSGAPQLLIEIIDVAVTRFCSVQSDFALAEGENDDLAGWQADHRRFFERNGGWSPQMQLVCERFTLIEDFGS